MSIPFNVTKSEIESSEDGKTLTLAFSGEFLAQTVQQNDLLNFMVNNPDMEQSEFHLGALPNGHDGFTVNVQVQKADFENFMQIKKLMAQAKELAGPGATEEEVQAQFKRLFADATASNLAKQVDEASSINTNKEGENGGQSSANPQSSN